MEFLRKIDDASSKPLLCVQFNPFKREIYTGGEDAIIRVWEGDSGKLITTLTDHIGWITNLLYCKELKVLFSASIDGMIMVWGSAGGANWKLLQKIETKTPIYCFAYNSRRQQLLVGYDRRVRVFQTISSEDNHGSLDVLERRSVACSEHNDVVSCMVSCEGRFYSAGYDRKIVIYDIPHHGDLKLKVSHTIPNAHDAAISCMVYGKDADNSWLITGSFDRTVKLWSLDGNLLQRFDGFSDTITSVCYVLPTQTLWITASSSSPVVYDPRSGINVSDFVSTNDERINQNNGALCFKQLLFVPELNEVIGTTNRRSVTIWKYNPIASVTVLSGHMDVVECLAFTSKEPLLIFSGGSDGVIRKWERLQLNTFMYSQESLSLPKEENKEEESTSSSNSRTNPEERRKKQQALRQRVTENLDLWKRGIDEDLKNHETQVELMSADTLKAFRRQQYKLKTQLQRRVTESTVLPEVSIGKKKPPPSVAAIIAGHQLPQTKPALVRPGVLSLTYYEELDLLISAYEDSRIHVWGYNEEVVKYVPDEGEKEKDNDQNGIGDSVTNRVAGMTLKYTLTDHREPVTGTACFFRDGGHWMLSTGWDRRICIYDLKQGKLHDIFRNNLGPMGKEELAADGIILSLEYCHERNEFGYASADKVAYIRRFSPKGDEMFLQAALVGHEAEVTQIKWNRIYQQWVTGSEDRTIRIWASEGLPLIKVINNDGPVTALCVDVVNGCLMTGSQDKCIRVFDPEKKDEVVVQKNSGHTDEVRAIIHIPVRNQYVSASWDNTVRIWNAYLKKGQRRITTKTASAFYTNNLNMMDEVEDTKTFDQINPLVIPKLLSKPFMKDNVIERKTQDLRGNAEQLRLEDELKTTLNDLEFALSGEKMKKKREFA